MSSFFDDFFNATDGDYDDIVRILNQDHTYFLEESFPGERNLQFGFDRGIGEAAQREYNLYLEQSQKLDKPGRNYDFIDNVLSGRNYSNDPISSYMVPNHEDYEGEDLSALKPQDISNDSLRSFAVQRRLRRRAEELENKSACIIQRVVRSCHYRRTFSKIKQQLRVLQGENPVRLMKRLHEPIGFDRSLGTHVMFRLAGVKFPPAIVYKICTSVSLVDVNSGSKRRGASTEWRLYCSFEYRPRPARVDAAKCISKSGGRYVVKNRRCLKWIKEKYRLKD